MSVDTVSFKIGSFQENHMTFNDSLIAIGVINTFTVFAYLKPRDAYRVCIGDTITVRGQCDYNLNDRTLHIGSPFPFWPFLRMANLKSVSHDYKWLNGLMDFKRGDQHIKECIKEIDDEIQDLKQKLGIKSPSNL